LVVKFNFVPELEHELICARRRNVLSGPEDNVFGAFHIDLGTEARHRDRLLIENVVVGIRVSGRVDRIEAPNLVSLQASRFA
jgi:hypothetical protein